MVSWDGLNCRLQPVREEAVFLEEATVSMLPTCPGDLSLEAPVRPGPSGSCSRVGRGCWGDSEEEEAAKRGPQSSSSQGLEGIQGTQGTGLVTTPAR